MPEATGDGLGLLNSETDLIVSTNRYSFCGTKSNDVLWESRQRAPSGPWSSRWVGMLLRVAYKGTMDGYRLTGLRPARELQQRSLSYLYLALIDRVESKPITIH